MGWFGFGTGAKERARLTLVKAQEMERHATTIIAKLRKIEYALEETRKELPNNTSGDSLQALQHTMEVSERHIEQMETHLEHVRDHVEKFKEHIESAKRNGSHSQGE